MTWVTLDLPSLLSPLSSPVRTERTKSPGWLWLSRTRKLPCFPFSVNNFSASFPERCPWNHLNLFKRKKIEFCHGFTTFFQKTTIYSQLSQTQLKKKKNRHVPLQQVEQSCIRQNLQPKWARKIAKMSRTTIKLLKWAHGYLETNILNGSYFLLHLSSFENTICHFATPNTIRTNYLNTAI